MVDYYVLVSVLDSPRFLEYDLCGHLYSTHYKNAEKEVDEYRAKLNGGWTVDVLRGQFHVVTASTKATTRGLRGWSKFKTRRVTDPKWKR